MSSIVRNETQYFLLNALICDTFNTFTVCPTLTTIHGCDPNIPKEAILTKFYTMQTKCFKLHRNYM